ncbi:MAG: helix-turn-helix transcriptional regulator [Gammaproteobacteria bacterium]
MSIRIKLDELLLSRKVRSKDLAEFVGITEQNISLIKTGQVKGIRFNTLAKLCEFLDCQPGDLLAYTPDE